MKKNYKPKTVKIRQKGRYACAEFLAENCKKVIGRCWTNKGRVVCTGLLLHKGELNADMQEYLQFLPTIGITDIKPFRVDKIEFKKTCSVMKRMDCYKNLF